MNSTDIDWNDVIKKEVRRIIMKMNQKIENLGESNAY